MTRPSLVLVLIATLAAPLAAAARARSPLPRSPLHGTMTATGKAGKAVSSAATLRQAAQQTSASKRPAAGAASVLPPTAPTVLKTPQNATPTLSTAARSPTSPPPQSVALAQSTAPKPPTPAEVRSQAAPPDAAPLRPPTPPAPANPPGRPPKAASSAPPAPTAAPTEPIPPKAFNLPPGPLSNLPVKITTAPNEVRISGLGSSSAPWSIVLLLTLLSVMPAILICVTPFARLLVVFHFLRQALGLQTTPSNQTLIGLTLILTFFIMEPVGKQVYEQSLIPLENNQITAFEAIARSEGPLREFMVHFVREKDAALFLEIAKEPRPHNIHDLSMRVLLPAYIVSELKAGFQIGAVLFLPFLVVDMVVASITTSVGMMQLPPVVISTPLKLMLFLMVDGWHLLIGALVRSFN